LDEGKRRPKSINQYKNKLYILQSTCFSFSLAEVSRTESAASSNNNGITTVLSNPTIKARRNLEMG
jgi:NAD/NADP transhydrogenase beta subunit